MTDFFFFLISQFIGNVHGDEPVGRELLLRLANWICDNYMKDSLVFLFSFHYMSDLKFLNFILQFTCMCFSPPHQLAAHLFFGFYLCLHYLLYTYESLTDSMCLLPGVIHFSFLN